MKSDGGIWKLKYPHSNSKERISQQILNELKVELYGFVSCHESIVTSLIHTTDIKLGIGKIILSDIHKRESPGNQLLALFDVVESLAKISPNRDPRKDLLELLLNFNDCRIIAEFTRNVVRKHCELVFFEDDILEDDISKVQDSEDESRPAACKSIQKSLLVTEVDSALPKLGRLTSKRKTMCGVLLITMVAANTAIILLLIVLNAWLTGQVLTSIDDTDSTSLPSTRGTPEMWDTKLTYFAAPPPPPPPPMYVHVPFDNAHLNNEAIERDLLENKRSKELYLTGYMNVNAIIRLLNQSVNVSHVVLSNESNRSCSYIGTSEMNQTTVVLKLTESLTMDYFLPSCAGLCQNLITNFRMPNLKQFVVKNSFINEQNAPCLQQILTHNFKDITYIKFENTTMENFFPLFGVRMVNALKNVTIAYFDFITDFVTPAFSEAFPKLNTISSKLGFLEVQQLQHLRQCKHLSNLTIPIKLNLSTHFELEYLVTGFTNLQYLNLELLHDNCNNRSLERTEKVLHIENLYNLTTGRLRTVSMRSKCRLIVKPGNRVLGGQWEGNHTIGGGYYSCYYKFKSKNQTVN